MSYFLIYGCEEGTRIVQFRSADKLKIYLESYWGDESISFLNYIEEDKKEFYCDDFMVIKGEVIQPKPINIVKTYEIE